MADAHGSGPCVRKDVRVQIPPRPRVARCLSGDLRSPSREPRFCPGGDPPEPPRSMVAVCCHASQDPHVRWFLSCCHASQAPHVRWLLSAATLPRTRTFDGCCLLPHFTGTPPRTASSGTATWAGYSNVTF